MDAVTRHMYQQAIGQVAEKGLSPEVRAPHRETIESYVGQLEANAEQTVKQIEELRAQVLELGERAPKGELERVSGELKLAQERAEETARAHEEALQKLRAELEEAQREDPRIAGLTQQVQELTMEKDGAVRLVEELRKRESSGETVPKATFEEAQRAIRELEDEIGPLRAELEKASGEENPLVIRLKKQVAELERTQEETGLKHQEALQALRDEVQRLTLSAENHPREIEEITRRADGEAEKAAALQLEMRRYQEVALEVARTPHGEVAALLEETGRQHAAIVGDSPQEQADKAFLTYKIGLLEAKQAEHVAIQKNLEAAHRTGAEEALRSPELALERQSEIFRAQREQMAMDADILTTPGAGIDQRYALINAEYEKLTASRAELVDVESQGVEVQLRALELDRQVAQLASQLQMLETLRKTLQGFEEIGRGQAGLGLTELHRVTSEALVAAREEHRRLSEVVDGRDEGAIALQAEKVRGLEAQVEQLRVAVESYQEHAATRVAADAKFLEQLITLVPREVPGEQVMAYLLHAVQAIAAIQQTLTPEFRPDGVHHSRIEGLLQQIYTWNQQYFRALNDSVDAVHGPGLADSLYPHLRYELPNVLPTIVGYMQMPAANIEGEIVARRATMDQLDVTHGQLDAVRDGGRDERAIQANRAQFAIENIYLNTLLAIQGVHQPLRDAHAAEKTDLEWQKSVLGTMQRLIVGFFSMLFSIPRAMLEGLQTVGHPLVGKK